MCVEKILELHVVPLRRVVSGCCKAPAHVHLTRCIAITCVFVYIVARNLVQLSPDFLGDVFDNFGVGVGSDEVVAEDGLVKGEDALDLDAESDLESGIDHVDSVFG